MAIVRKHMYIDGIVQGVGFRYRAYYAAQSLELTGWVRNLYDGRVEVEVQGEELNTLSFLDKIEDGSFIHITNIESRKMDVDPNERSFKIRHSD